MSDQPASGNPENPASTQEVDPCTAAGIAGAEHVVLNALAGTWNAKVSFWMQPGADPVSAEGTMVNEWILGGRFLQQNYKSMFMGQPFEGRGLFGYNNVDGCYEGLWADTMSTGMMTEKGEYSEPFKTFTMLGEVTEPASKQTMRKKTVITLDSADQHTMSMHFSDAGTDTFWKCMEIVYTRP